MAQITSSILNQSCLLRDPNHPWIPLRYYLSSLFFFFPPILFHLGSHIFPTGSHSSFSNFPASLASNWLLNFGLTLPKAPPTSSKSSCPVYCFPAKVWLLYSSLFSTSVSSRAFPQGTGQSFKSVLTMFKSFSWKQIFAYANPTFAIWFFLLPSQRNSQFHIYFGK